MRRRVWRSFGQAVFQRLVLRIQRISGRFRVVTRPEVLVSAARVRNRASLAFSAPIEGSGTSSSVAVQRTPRRASPTRASGPSRYSRRFIEKDKAHRIHAAQILQERVTRGCHIRPVDLARPRAFFLSTNPARRIARRRLVSFVRSAAATRRLYSQHSSATVPSGAARTIVVSIWMSIGHDQPPPFGRGATLPVARACATQRCKVRYAIPNVSARRWYPPSPALYAATARCRNTMSYASAMPTLKYS